MSIDQKETLEDLVQGTVAAFLAVFHNSLIYSPHHTQVLTSLKQFDAATAKVFDHIDPISLIGIEKEIIFNGRSMLKAGIHFDKLAKFMRKINIQVLRIYKGVTSDELRLFVFQLIGLDANGEPVDQKVARSTTHIRLGEIVSVTSSRDETFSNQNIADVLGIDAVEDSEQTPDEEDPDAQLKEQTKKALLNLIYDWDRFVAFFAPLIDIKKHDAASFHHSLRVAYLTILTAVQLKLPTEHILELVKAAISHDVGKLDVPAEVLAQALPTKESAPLVKSHPLSGAQRLLKTAAETPLPAIVAYEHHRLLNGAGYPEKMRAKEPHSFAQLTGLADLFDQSLMQENSDFTMQAVAQAIKQLVTKRQEGGLNAAWVDSFLNVLKTL